jgi:hypothetical protein
LADGFARINSGFAVKVMACQLAIMIAHTFLPQKVLQVYFCRLRLRDLDDAKSVPLLRCFVRIWLYHHISAASLFVLI